jgi:hypothetical protein
MCVSIIRNSSRGVKPGTVETDMVEQGSWNPKCEYCDRDPERFYQDETGLRTNFCRWHSYMFVGMLYQAGDKKAAADMIHKELESLKELSEGIFLDTEAGAT